LGEEPHVPTQYKTEAPTEQVEICARANPLDYCRNQITIPLPSSAQRSHHTDYAIPLPVMLCFVTHCCPKLSYTVL